MIYTPNHSERFDLSERFALAEVIGGGGWGNPSDHLARQIGDHSAGLPVAVVITVKLRQVSHFLRQIGDHMAHTEAPTALDEFTKWADANMKQLDRLERRQAPLQAADRPLDLTDAPDWLRQLAERH